MTILARIQTRLYRKIQIQFTLSISDVLVGRLRLCCCQALIRGAASVQVSPYNLVQFVVASIYGQATDQKPHRSSREEPSGTLGSFYERRFGGQRGNDLDP